MSFGMDGDDLDDLDVEDPPFSVEPGDQSGTESVVSDTGAEEEKDEEKYAWMLLSPDLKCRDVLAAFDEKTPHIRRRRWAEKDGDPNIDVLEQYKEKWLMNRDVKSEIQPITALHVLARNYDRSNDGESSKENKFTKDRNSPYYKDKFSPESIKMLTVPLLERFHGQQSVKDLDHEFVDKASANESSTTPSEQRPGSATEAQPKLFIHMAMDHRMDSFIARIKEWWPDGFRRLLADQDSEGMNCLHYVFMLRPTGDDFGKRTKNLKDLTTRRIPIFEPCADGATLAAKDRLGNTPIHYAMRSLQCSERDDTYIETVKRMILRADKEMIRGGETNKKNESPYQYCLQTIKETKLRPKRPDAQKPKSMPPIPWVKSPQNVAPRALSPMKPTPGIAAVNGIASKTDKIAREEAAAEKAEDDKASALKGSGGRPAKLKRPLTINGGEALVPPTQQQDGKLKQEVKTAQTTGHRTEKALLIFLGVHYIRTRSDRVARNLIYGRNKPQKHLYFDATGLRSGAPRNVVQAREIIDLLSRMSPSTPKFNSTLSYVYLPPVARNQEASLGAGVPVTKAPKSDLQSQGDAEDPPKEENPNQGRNELVQVFNKLYHLGVRSIIRLYVQDFELPSHSDTAIETALRGRDQWSLGKYPRKHPDGSGKDGFISVEVLDWRKPDLSADVIRWAAQHVKELYLYWSGNPAVLQSWISSETGLPRLSKQVGGQLETVHLYAAPGLETRERMDIMLDNFKKKLIDMTKDKNGATVELRIEHQMSGLFPELSAHEEVVSPSVGRTKEQGHDWIIAMENFRGALKVAHNRLKKRFAQAGLKAPTIPRVKIALVDDGADLNGLDKEALIDGDSFFMSSDTREAEKPYYVSTAGHGTIMAEMILRINPWVELHVLRLQDTYTSDRRLIYAASAADAIKSAIDRDVHIISMSWTIKRKGTSANKAPPAEAVAGAAASPSPNKTTAEVSYDERALRQLEDAVESAKDKKKIMFCSASDRIQVGSRDSLPYKQAPNDIFRIGAALPYGERDPQAEDEPNISYFFPGTQVAGKVNPRAAGGLGMLPPMHDGSSVATALAAGLASLIIYCAILLSKHFEAEKNTEKMEKFGKFAVELKKPECMKRAFNNIRHDDWKDPKYLPVWKMFGETADSTHKDNPGGPVDSFKALESLMDDLCHGIKPE